MHEHPLKTVTPDFRIDAKTREVIQVGTDFITLMQFDHNSEKLRFECPRYIDGHDMSLTDKIEVHFVNSMTATDVHKAAKYRVKDLEVSPDNPELVNFSWVVDRNATEYVGTLVFSVQFICLDGTKIDYAWHTSPFSYISVDQGLVNELDESYTALYLDNLETEAEGRIEQITTATLDRAIKALEDSIVNDVQTLGARMDTFTKLAEGSTTGDAELMDARIGTDGTTYTTVGTASRTQIGAIEKLVYTKVPLAYSGDGYNLFNISNCTYGYYRVLNEVRENTQYCYTENILVEPSTAYIVSANGVPLTSAIIVALDKNGNDIDGLTPIDGVFTTTEKTYFVVLSFQIADAENKLQIEKGTEITKYKEYLTCNAKTVVEKTNKLLVSPVKIMSQLVNATKTIHIKLIGDSITAGVGGTGFNSTTDGGGDYIFGSYHSNTTGYCWANLLKDYLESKFDCVVKNYGCSGNYSADTVEHLSDLISDDDDIVICMIGTNNRPSERFVQLYSDLKTIHQYCVDNEKDIIFMGGTPAEVENDEHTMADVNNTIMGVATSCGLEYISLYKLMTEYCLYTGTKLGSILKDGLHPNDTGYGVMFYLICNALGFNTDIPLM